MTLGSINSLMAQPLQAYNPGKAAIVRLTYVKNVMVSLE